MFRLLGFCVCGWVKQIECRGERVKKCIANKNISKWKVSSLSLTFWTLFCGWLRREKFQSWTSFSREMKVKSDCTENDEKMEVLDAQKTGEHYRYRYSYSYRYLRFTCGSDFHVNLVNTEQTLKHHLLHTRAYMLFLLCTFPNSYILISPLRSPYGSLLSTPCTHHKSKDDSFLS